MSPRSYRLGERQVVVDQTRARIISAARALLMTGDAFTAFTIESVAREADVARMTVYYQFGSKVGLLEAICDSLAASGGMEQLAGAFRQPDALDGLTEYIRVFSQFWDADRLVTRRLRGLAALDQEFELVIRARDERRRKGLRVIVQRLIDQHGRPAPEALDKVVNILYTLISFETFDTLAGTVHTCVEVAPIVQHLARSALDVGI